MRLLEKTVFFWHGYNTCNYTLMEQYLDLNVEFYHDNGGLIVGADKVMDATRKNICGLQNIRVRREAVAGTIQLFPLEDNGKISRFLTNTSALLP